MAASTRNFAAVVVGLGGLGLVWQFASQTFGEYWVPGPQAVALRLVSELSSGKLLLDLASTFELLLSGTLLGAFLGIALACVLRLLPRADAALQPFITALMSVPKLGLVPLLVLWFGTGWAPKVMLVTLTVLFIVFSLTYAGLVTVNAKLVMTAKVFGATPLQVTKSIVLPSVLPFVFTGLEVALPWAVSAALVAEYLSAKVGIGHGIEHARQMSDSVGIYHGIVLATLLVLAFNGVLWALRRLCIKGQPQEF